jgi:hypothetical protein
MCSLSRVMDFFCRGMEVLGESFATICTHFVRINICTLKAYCEVVV